MSEIGEKAEKIWREQTEIIKRKKELIAAQTKHYANLILDVFGASDELAYVSAVFVFYDSNNKRLKCFVQLFDDIDAKTDNDYIYGYVHNSKVMEAMNNVNACEAENCTILTKIYNLLVADSQVTKYFEVTSAEDSTILIKMRPEDEVTPDETICENEESEE